MPGGTRKGYKLARPGGAHSVLVACGSPRSFPERHVGPLATPGGFGHPERHTRSATSEFRPRRGAALRRAQCQIRTPPSSRAPPGGRASEAGGGFEPGSGRPPAEACKAHPEVPRLAWTTFEFRFAPAADARPGLRCRRRTGVSSTENPATPAAHTLSRRMASPWAPGTSRALSPNWAVKDRVSCFRSSAARGLRVQGEPPLQRFWKDMKKILRNDVYSPMASC